jgi:ubiquinone/menaquinone biosynthesis C-methylase UbiE
MLGMARRATANISSVSLLPPGLFDQVARRFHSEDLKRQMADLLQLKPQHRVLDAASGTSQLLPLIVPSRYFGFDLEANRVALARKAHGGRHGFAAADASRLCYRTGSFDRVMASGLFHHVDDGLAQGILNEFARVLTPDGHVVILDAIWPRHWWNLPGYVGRMLDDGRHVRYKEAYLRMFSERFSIDAVRYTHRWTLDLILVSMRPKGRAA